MPRKKKAIRSSPLGGTFPEKIPEEKEIDKMDKDDVSEHISDDCTIENDAAHLADGNGDEGQIRRRRRLQSLPAASKSGPSDGSELPRRSQSFDAGKEWDVVSRLVGKLNMGGLNVAKEHNVAKDPPRKCSYDDISEWKLQLAAYYFGDALEGRLDNGLASNFESENRLTFRCCYVQTHPAWYAIVVGSCLLHSLLVIFEPTWVDCHTCRQTLGYSWQAWSWMNTAEVAFVLTYAVDIALKCAYMGISVFMSLKGSKAWQTTYAVLVVLMFFDAVFNTGWRFTRPLRPIVLVLRSRAVRNFYVTVLKILPSLFDVGKFLVFLVFGFALVMVRLLANSSTQRFKSSSRTSAELVALLLTCDNYQELYQDLMNQSGYTLSIFVFFAFIIIGILFLLQLVLGTVTDTYMEEAAEKKNSQVEKRTRGLLRAFDVLDEKKDGKLRLTVMQRFLKQLRPRDSLFERTLKTNILANWMEPTPAIDRIDFLHLMTVFDTKFIDGRDGIEHAFGAGAMSPRADMPFWRWAVRSLLIHKVYRNFNYMMMHADVVMFMADLEEWPVGPFELNDTFQAISLLHCSFKVLEHGSLANFHLRTTWRRQIECTGSILLTLQLVLYWYFGWQHRAAFGCVRILRIARVSPSLQKFLECVLSIAPNILQMLAFIFVVHYIFAVVGLDWLGPRVASFASYSLAGETLLQLMLQIDTMSVVQDAVDKTHPIAFIFFALYYMMAVAIVMNLITALMIEFYRESLAHSVISREDDQDDILRSLQDISAEMGVVQAMGAMRMGPGREMEVLRAKYLEGHGESVDIGVLRKVQKKEKTCGDLVKLYEKKKEALEKWSQPDSLSRSTTT